MLILILVLIALLLPVDHRENPCGIMYPRVSLEGWGDGVYLLAKFKTTKMKKSLLLTIAIFLIHFELLNAQLPTVSESIGLYNYLRVNASNLNLRTNPSLDSEVLAVLQTGDALINLDTTTWHSRKRENIQGKWGDWIRVKYQGKMGYVFSPYIANQIQLLYEDNHIHTLPKDAYFYGLYATESGDSLKRIKVKTYISENNYGEKESMLGVTGEKAKSILVLASNRPLKEGIIGLFLKEFAHRELIIKPGVERAFYHKKEGYTVVDFLKIYASGSYEMTNRGLWLRDPAIHLSRHKVHSQTHAPAKLHLGGTFPLQEGFEIEYFGDLDGDNITDLILRSCTNHGCQNILLLSSFAKKRDILCPVSRFNWVDGC